MAHEGTSRAFAALRALAQQLADLPGACMLHDRYYNVVISTAEHG